MPYVVTYRKDGKIRDKGFPTLDQAHAFYAKKKKFGDAAILSRVDQVAPWENWINTMIVWGPIKLPALPILLALLALGFAWLIKR